MKRNSLLNRVINKAKRICDFAKDRYMFFCVNYPVDSNHNYALRKIGLKMALRGRKLVGFYGECHIYVYQDLITNSSQFKNKYVAIGSKEIEYLARYHSKYIQKKNIWDKMDVLIYNPGIPKREGAPRLVDVLNWVPESALKIEVTNAAFKGYMPQHTEKVFENGGYFVWGDKNINRIIDDDSMNKAAELEKLMADDYYKADYVNGFFDKNLKWMKQYEKKCTIKIADYIEEHGRDRILYYSVTHPEFEILHEIARRIGFELGIDDIKSGTNSKGEFCGFELHSHGEIVYPSVGRALGINEDVYKNRKIKSGNYDIEYNASQYIREYFKLGNQKNGTNV